jgi:anti-sigma factor RsiW
VTTHDDIGHLSAERLQDLLEGGLGRSERKRAEDHLAACPRCAAELETWSTLFEELEALPGLRPHEGFAGRVLDRVDLAEPRSLAARMKARAAGVLVGGSDRHVEEELLQDLVDGMLPTRRAARVRAHLETCAPCATEAGSWKGVFRGLNRLPRLEPSAAFADEVMARVRVAAPAPAPRKAMLPGLVPALTAAGRRLVPRTRRAWAALSGAAVTPAVVVSLLLYAVFSHPTLTPGALASFLWWQVTDLAGAGWASLSTVALEGSAMLGLQGVFAALASAPLAAAGIVIAYGALTVLALRVLYRNLMTTRVVDGDYA